MPPLTGPVGDLPLHPTRRDALRLFAAGAAALVAGCKDSGEQLVPYIAQPEGMVPGIPRFFATSLALDGTGRGVVVESHEGRPTKIHGNPAHPASLGATDVFAEAAVLDLFDPHRPRVPRSGNAPASWSAFETALAGVLPQDGRGARLLTGPVGSPTLARQIGELLTRRPGMRWHAMDPAARALETRLGNRRLRAVPDFGAVATVVSLGCDFLGPGPDQVPTARAFIDARRDRPGAIRLTVVEPGPTLTGAKADRRVMASMADVGRLARWLDARADGATLTQDLPAPLRDVARHLAVELDRAAPGTALVLAAPELPARTAHAVARLNDRLAAPLAYTEASSTWEGMDPGGISELAEDMRSGAVSALVVLDADPAFEASAELDVAGAMDRVPFKAFAGVTWNDTAALCDWRLPLAHELEDWSDLRGPDGTVGLVQPLIAPLHGSRSRHELLDLLAHGPAAARPAREILRRTWRLARGAAAEGAEAGRAASEFEEFWTAALHDGSIAGTSATGVLPDLATVPPDDIPDGPPDTDADAFELLLRPSPTVWAGAPAGNAWLQECPEPVTKQVWGNALWMAPADARRLGLAEGDAVSLSTEYGTVEVPVLAIEGQHPGTLSLALGHGRRDAGPIGSDVGVNAAPLRPRDGTTLVAGAIVTPLGGTLPVRRTQHHFEQGARDILRTVMASDPRLPEPEPVASFFPPWSAPDTNAWGMVIDLDACIGCNACLVACQSENNVPVVGPEEVERGRIMHWLRIDAYAREDGAPSFQPVPCMHCEKAPCEPVCPVAASVHDAQGLNLQVYNRCIGTRFCQANCPYKVRRFNFFDYAEGQSAVTGDPERDPSPEGTDLLAALRNPEVTVRARGVMEKCTYCVQRIEAAKHEAARTGEPIPPGAVRTACQNACPTEAISFGDLNAPGSEVARLRQDPRHYALLGELGTRPRTTYLARVENDRSDGT